MLSEEELEMVVVLRVNKKFMVHMKAKHPELVRQVRAAMPLFVAKKKTRLKLRYPSARAGA